MIVLIQQSNNQPHEYKTIIMLLNVQNYVVEQSLLNPKAWRDEHNKKECPNYMYLYIN